MATSGSTNYNRNRNQIIQEALEILNVVGAGETAAAEDISTASTTLNIMIKAWQAQGRHLWGLTEGTILVTKGTESYSLPGASGSNTVVKTEIGAAEASGQTAITVDSTTGMSASDVVLIEQDDGTLHSSTISSVDDSTTITIADALTDAAAVDNHVYVYTTAIGRPVRILHARWRDQNENDRELQEMSREEYYNISDKDVQGKPIGYYYDPQLTTANLKLWPAPNTVKDTLKITYERSLEDFDNSTDDPDFPQEWLMALVYNLALNLAPKFETDLKKVQNTIAPLAFKYLDDALNHDADHTSISISPDIRN